MASVLLLNQYFPPDQVSTAGHAFAIAARLAREGHSVSALVGQPSYASGLDPAPARERIEGVEITRIELGARSGRERMGTRVEGYFRYLVGAWWRSRRSRPDLVLSFHNPPPLGLVAASVARRSKARFVHVVQDIHPDIVVASGWMRLPSPAVRAWDLANRMVLRAADRTVVLGEGMRETLIAKGAAADTVEAIPLWAEPELEPRPRDGGWRRQHGIGGELVVLCAGNMGIMHPLEPLLDAAAALHNRPVRFVLAGGGVRREHWERETAARGLGDRVVFLDFQRGEDFARMVAAADVALVPLSEGMERLALPARTFALLSGGRPVIALMAPDADVARLVIETGAGWRVGNGDDLAGLLEQLLADPEAVARAGTRARESFERDFTREVITGRYARLVEVTLAAARCPGCVS